MALKCSRMLKQCFILLLVLLLHQTESKGGRRTGGGGGSKYNTGTRHSGTSHYNTGGSHYNTGGSHQNTGSHYDTAHQSHSYNTGNSNPVVPSAPVAPPTNNRNIGFENYNNQHAGSQSNNRDIGFENVQHRVPQQNSQAGFNAPPHHVGGHSTNRSSGGYNTYHPGSSGTYNNSHYGGNSRPTQFNSSSVPLNSGHPPQGYPAQGYPAQGYPQNNYNQGGYGYNQPHVQYPHIAQNPPGGYYNPSLSQPGSYYHPYQGVPNGPPPQIYQPYKQSSGGSALGYVGSLAGGLAGGYLIGRLTSGGGGGGNSGGGGGGQSTNNQYEVHHYYHNSDAIPKQFAVANGTLATCSQNDTQGLCVPNTFPICLYNGTVMCVTHTLYTTPCNGLNTTSACIITVLPCPAGDMKCNNTNNTNNAVYVPCISNVTLSNPGDLSTVGAAPSPASANRVELCVTAIAEPKWKPPPPPPVVNQPQILQAAGAPPPVNSNKNQGCRQSFTSGWVYGLIIMLWVGIK